jgi:hypothetical protein
MYNKRVCLHKNNRNSLSCTEFHFHMTNLKYFYKLMIAVTIQPDKNYECLNIYLVNSYHFNKE